MILNKHELNQLRGDEETKEALEILERKNLIQQGDGKYISVPADGGGGAAVEAAQRGKGGSDSKSGGGEGESGEEEEEEEEEGEEEEEAAEVQPERPSE